MSDDECACANHPNFCRQILLPKLVAAETEAAEWKMLLENLLATIRHYKSSIWWGDGDIQGNADEILSQMEATCVDALQEEDEDS